MACGPDVIFIGGLAGRQLRRLSPDRPGGLSGHDSDLGVVESVRQNTRAIASLFGWRTRPGNS